MEKDMWNIYIDEKGPQETFNISNPFDKVKKLSYGGDDMHSYVADAIAISHEHLSQLEDEYSTLEAEYLETRKQLKNKKELKGQYILDKKNFTFGIASMKKNELDFYSKLFKLLKKYNTENILFSISKMSLIIDSRLGEWILDISEKYGFSATILKYVLSKYAEIECSEEVIANLLDKSVNVNSVLISIGKDLATIIRNNKKNLRMQRQIEVYSQILSLIVKTQDSEIVEPDTTATFNWEKFAFPLDLWLTEGKIGNYFDSADMIAFLDQGIPIEPFRELNLHSINDEQESHEHIGLRIADMLVVIGGKYISKLSADVRYDFNNPSQRKQLDAKWFEFNQEQFELVKVFSEFFFKVERTYCFGVDTYFDEGVLFETFIRYIANFKTFQEYASISPSEHANRQFEYSANQMQSRWTQAVENESLAIFTFGSLRNAINEKMMHPL
ncbi:hypothetical protein K5O26_000685 [Enterococcus faecalis]|nr:hypothetical protein [Enterococcus faecalis]